MSVVIDHKLDPAAGVPSITDFQAALANDPRCLGIWNFSRDNIVQGLGGIERVNNLKTDGVPLVQTDSTKRPILVPDYELRRSVASFDSAVSKVLTAPGLTWRSDLAWTIFAIVKSRLATNNGDFHLIAGNVSGSDFVGLFTINTRVQYQVYPGRIAGPPAIAVGREGWNRLIASCTAAQEARGQSNEGTVFGAASGTSNGKPTTTDFQIGHDTFRAGIDLVAVGLHSVDVQASGNADLRDLTHAYCDALTDNYV